MQSLCTALLVCALTFACPAPGLGSEKARYAGGTLTNISEKAEGTLQFTDEGLLFKVDKRASDAWLLIPYQNIAHLEYGQRAGRRLGVAIAISPVFLFSKKRKHFLTISFVDSGGAKQGAVFELGKHIVKQTLSTLESRSKVQVEYESDEAREHASGLK